MHRSAKPMVNKTAPKFGKNEEILLADMCKMYKKKENPPENYLAARVMKSEDAYDMNL